MKKIFKRLLIAVVILLVLAVVALLIMRGINRVNQSVADSAQRYTVTKGDLSLTAVGSGKVVSSDIKKVTAKGTISELDVSVGDYVKQGDILAKYTDLTGNEANFTSDYEGVVTAVPGSAQSSSNYFEISSTNKLEVVVQITEKDVNKINVNQSATVYIDAIDANITGTVSRVSQYGTANGDYSSYAVTVSFDKGDSNILLGMTASAKITTQTKSGVYKVPVDAVIESGDKRYLLSSEWLNHINQPKSDYYVEVTTGISDSEYVEVSGEGLDNKEVLIISSSSSSSGVSFMKSLRS